MAAAGAATFAAGLWLVEDDSQARAVIEAIGAAAVILSPLAPRLEALSLGLRGVERASQAGLRGRPSSKPRQRRPTRPYWQSCRSWTRRLASRSSECHRRHEI